MLTELIIVYINDKMLLRQESEISLPSSQTMYNFNNL